MVRDPHVDEGIVALPTEVPAAAAAAAAAYESYSPAN